MTGNAFFNCGTQAAGGSLNEDAVGTVEVSPLVSYGGEGLQGRCEGNTFQANTNIEAAVTQ